MEPGNAKIPPAIIPIHSFESYRDYLLYIIEVRKDVKGIRSRLAEAASCQPSYLSQVLAGSASFSLDQLHGISRYLGLGAGEWDYLRELGILERAANKALRDDCLRRLRALAAGDRQGATADGPAARPNAEDLAWYTSHWLPVAVAAAVHSHALRTTEAVAKRFNLSLAQARQVLGELDERGFVRIEKGEWVASLNENLFLGREGCVQAFRATWFQHGQQRRGSGYRDGSQTGAVFCMTRAEYEELRTRVTSEFRRFFASLPPETDGDVVVHYAVDLFEA